jgi:PPE-repeat protein
MDFGSFPPEINSARIYAGPGSAPMLAAASAWDGLAAELRSAGSVYQAVIGRLASEEWMGPASAAMAAAATPYATWMNTTAEQAEQTAAQAKAAAAAFEAAFAMTVPPPAVAANRAQLAALVATNVLGQNTPAIAANEAHYGQMWAQDAGAMYGYAANSAAATTVTPFAAPRQNTNPAGQTAQANAVAQAAGNSAGSGTQSALSQFVSTTPNTLQGLASPLQSTTSESSAAALSNFLGSSATGNVTNAMSNLLSSSFSPMGLAGITQAGADIAILRGAGIAAGDPFGLGALDLPGVATPGLGLGGLGLGHLFPGIGLGAFAPASLSGAVTAGMGQATPIGALSVPASWTAAAPVATPPAASASLVSSWTAAAPAAEAGGMPGMPGMPMAGSGAGRGYGFAAPRYGFKPTIMPRPVIAG